MPTSLIADGRTIPGVLERVAVRHADGDAMVEADVRLTFAELLDRVRGAAGAVITMGLSPGDAAAIWAPNSIDWAVASLAILFAGGSVVPVNTRYTTPEAREILSRSRSRLVFAHGDFLGRNLAAEAGAMGLDLVVLSLGGDVFADDGGEASSAELDRRLRALAPDAISHIQFTSGTTGRPKGAMLRHDPMVRTTADWAGVVGLRAGDRYPVISPFSHIGGHKTGLLASMTAGATAYPFTTLDVDLLTSVIETEGITFLQGPPTIFHELIRRAEIEPGRFTSLRIGVTGGAVVAPTLVRAMIDVLGLESVVTSYGLTETTGVCTITRPGDAIEIIAETSGRPIPNVELRIVDPDDPNGQPRPDGDRGEVLVRGFNVMAGYLDDVVATRNAIRDGWFRTGDIGWIGDDGNLRIVDRLKDMLIVGGFNAYPAEIELALLEHPSVDQVAVVGVKDARLGEAPAAFIVANPARPATPEDIIAFCKERLANFKLPRHIWFVDSFPVNSAGKIQKTDLRAEVASLLSAETPSLRKRSVSEILLSHERAVGAAAARGDAVKKTFTVAGRKISLDDILADQDSASAPIVLVHGANVNRTIWEPVVERVRGTRRVVVPDMPGHGESPGPAPTKVDEWVEILAGLNSQLGLGPSIIVGHSLGGAAAQAYYTTHPDHFVAIGLISTTPSFGMDHDMVQRWLDDPETHKAEELMIIASHAGDDFKNRLVELRSSNGQESIANDLRAIEGWDTAGQPISVPAIVVTASNDFVPIRDACAHWRDTLHQVTYVDLEGPGHHMMLEAPTETSEAIGKWVDGLGA